MDSDWLLKPIHSFVHDGEKVISLRYWVDEGYKSMGKRCYEDSYVTAIHM